MDERERDVTLSPDEVDVADPSDYDMVMNTGKITSAPAAETIAPAFQTWQNHPADVH